MTDQEKWEATKHEDYDAYIRALCRLASWYVSPIRVQFAEKAVEMFTNETVRRLVLAYGEEIKKLDEDRLREFKYSARYGASTKHALKDSCLNKSEHYSSAIYMLFDIDY